MVDGMEGGTGASAEISQEHTGIPTLAAVCEARAALEDIGVFRRGTAYCCGGHPKRGGRGEGDGAGGGCRLYRNGGPDCAELQQADLRFGLPEAGYRAHYCHHCHTGRCPVGITTQHPDLMARLDIDEASERVANLLQAMTSEVQILARACGKADVHDLDPDDLRALTSEASMTCGIPLVGNEPGVWRGAGLGGEISPSLRRL